MTQSDDPNVYASPLPIEVQAAVGRVITCWAAIESSLQLQVGRMVAVYPEDGELSFNPTAFVRTAMLAGGTHPRAMITQIINLAKGFNADKVAAIKASGDNLLKLRERRDDLAHLFPMAKDATAIELRYISGSKARWYSEKTFTIAQMDGWTHSMKAEVVPIFETGA